MMRVRPGTFAKGKGVGLRAHPPCEMVRKVVHELGGQREAASPPAVLGGPDELLTGVPLLALDPHLDRSMEEVDVGRLWLNSSPQTAEGGQQDQGPVTGAHKVGEAVHPVDPEDCNADDPPTEEKAHYRLLPAS